MFAPTFQRGVLCHSAPKKGRDSADNKPLIVPGYLFLFLCNPAKGALPFRFTVRLVLCCFVSSFCEPSFPQLEKAPLFLWWHPLQYVCLTRGITSDGRLPALIRTPSFP